MGSGWTQSGNCSVECLPGRARQSAGPWRSKQSARTAAPLDRSDLPEFPVALFQVDNAFRGEFLCPFDRRLLGRSDSTGPLSVWQLDLPITVCSLLNEIFAVLCHVGLLSLAVAESCCTGSLDEQLVFTHFVWEIATLGGQRMTRSFRESRINQVLGKLTYKTSVWSGRFVRDTSVARNCVYSPLTLPRRLPHCHVSAIARLPRIGIISATCSPW